MSLFLTRKAKITTATATVELISRLRTGFPALLDAVNGQIVRESNFSLFTQAEHNYISDTRRTLEKNGHKIFNTRDADEKQGLLANVFDFAADQLFGLVMVFEVACDYTWDKARSVGRALHLVKSELPPGRPSDLDGPT